MRMIDKKIREYLLPEKILAESKTSDARCLLENNTDQAYFGGDCGCTLAQGAYLLLDFGRELSGGVKLICNECSGNKNARLRIVFGESAMEALSNLGEKGSSNDHAVRDETLTVPWVGAVEFGNTGFRFVRIENKSDYAVSLRQVFAVFVHSDIVPTGTFRCSDERINRIWAVGAYTVFLNMQDYVYDGIKRDRVVWIGDMHPETSAILRLYGKDERVERSLELVRKNTPPTEWMNAIPSYSMWWIKIVYDYYLYTGDREFTGRQISYMCAVTERLIDCVHSDGSYCVGDKFIDWPSSDNPAAQEAGVRALLFISIECAQRLWKEFPHEKGSGFSEKCECALRALTHKRSDSGGNKQAAALLCLAGLEDAFTVNRRLLSKEPLQGMSSFLGYYVLLTREKAGDMGGALELLTDLWRAMLDLGATTFWEDFSINWAKGARPIDSILSANEYDVHGDNGDYCYRGYRHSLCHGWAAGPVPFLSECVLGIRVVEAGCNRIEISPRLGDLQWAEGSVPTPYGAVYIRHEKTLKGIKSVVRAPQEIVWTLTSINEEKNVASEIIEEKQPLPIETWS